MTMTPELTEDCVPNARENTRSGQAEDSGRGRVAIPSLLGWNLGPKPGPK